MNAYLESFKKEYNDGIVEVTGNICKALQDCLSMLGLDPDYKIDAPQINLKSLLKDLSNISDIEKHLQKLQYYRGYFKETVKDTINSNDGEYTIKSAVSRITDIIDYLSKQKARFYAILEDKIEEIRKCPYGPKNNKKRTKNALHFQKLVSQLFSWLFIDELCPLNLNKIENPKKQRRDAAFRVLDTFNAEQRCGYKFDHLFIECKNYNNPSHRDVIQVFSYTIFYNASNIFKIPLSLLVSRKNPEGESYAMNYRNMLYNKRIGDNETRVILFFDITDLEEMVNIKMNGGDPAFKIKTKIDEFKDKYIGFGG